MFALSHILGSVIAFLTPHAPYRVSMAANAEQWWSLSSLVYTSVSLGHCVVGSSSATLVFLDGLYVI